MLGTVYARGSFAHRRFLHWARKTRRFDLLRVKKSLECMEIAACNP